MIAGMRYRVDALAPLLQRANALPEFFKGYLDAHVSDAVKALETGLEMCEAMAADEARKVRPTAASPRGARLRVIEGQRAT